MFPVSKIHKTPAHVCRPGSDTVMLTEAALMEPPCSVLDMGTGSGYSAIELARRGFTVEACDICGDAVDASRQNAGRSGTGVRFFRSDLWESAGRYDLVIFNPPLSRAQPLLKGVLRRVPFSEQLGPLKYVVSGKFRREIVGRFIAGAKDHLNPGGRLLMVAMRPELPRVRALAADHRFKFDIVRRKGLYNIAKMSCCERIVRMPESHVGALPCPA